ncbi:MAG: hypothetical protein FVQ77_15945 [Cytophagales bacterium]|nr:hypothetical protein [Cytophagales bacterium]
MWKNIFKFRKIKLDGNQRKELGKAIYNAANLVLAIFVLGQFVSEQPFNLFWIIFGFVFFILSFIIATILNKE